MSKPLTDRVPFAKLVTIFAASFGVGLGLCGVDYLLAAHGIGKRTEELGVGPLDTVSLVVMILSLSGLVISLIAWAVVGVWRSLGSGRGGGDVQTMSDNSDVSNFGDRSSDPVIQKPPRQKDD